MKRFHEEENEEEYSNFEDLISDLQTLQIWIIWIFARVES